MKKEKIKIIKNKEKGLDRIDKPISRTLYNYYEKKSLKSLPKIKRNVAQSAEYILTDYNLCKLNNYLNLSFQVNVESATVAQSAEYLPHEQESSQTSGFEFLTRIPAVAPT